VEIKVATECSLEEWQITIMKEDREQEVRDLNTNIQGLTRDLVNLLGHPQLLLLQEEVVVVLMLSVDRVLELVDLIDKRIYECINYTFNKGIKRNLFESLVNNLDISIQTS